jgi:hypothetical protein
VDTTAAAVEVQAEAVPVVVVEAEVVVVEAAAVRKQSPVFNGELCYAVFQQEAVFLFKILLFTIQYIHDKNPASILVCFSFYPKSIK